MFHYLGKSISFEFLLKKNIMSNLSPCLVKECCSSVQCFHQNTPISQVLYIFTTII